jgi:hypothetical protein
VSSPHKRSKLRLSASRLGRPQGGPDLRLEAITARGGRIVAIDALSDPDRLGELDLTMDEAATQIRFRIRR